MNLRIGMTLFGLLFMSCDNNDSSTQKDEETENCLTGTFTANILQPLMKKFTMMMSLLAFSKYSWSSDGTSRILNGNGIPNHEVGTFPIQIIQTALAHKMLVKVLRFVLP